MTDTRAPQRQNSRSRILLKEKYSVISCSGVAFILLSVLLLWFILKDSSAAAAAAREGLLLAGKTVVPSLFPLLVLATLLVEEGLGDSLGKHVSRITEALLGVSGTGAGALILGLFCGFPIGARILVGAYERDALSRDEVKRLLPLANGPSFVFLFSVVGGLCKDPSFGLLLYASSVASTLLCGVLLRIVFGKCIGIANSPISHSHTSLPVYFVRAVTDAGKASVTITAFVVFFSVVSSALTSLLLTFGAPNTLSLFLSGVLELSNGMKKAAETGTGLCGRALCGFFAGWGGLCAHLQVIATAERLLPDRARRSSVSFRSYFLCKILIGLLTAAIVLLSEVF